MSLGKVDEPEGGGTVGISKPFYPPKKEGFFAKVWRKIKAFFSAIF